MSSVTRTFEEPIRNDGSGGGGWGAAAASDVEKSSPHDLKERFDSLGEAAKWANLVDWNRSPLTLKEDETTGFSEARKEVLQVISNEKKESPKKDLAYEFMERLFKLDPITEDTVYGLCDTMEEMSHLIHPRSKDIGIKKLIAIYAAGIETLLSQIEADNILAIPRETRVLFSTVVETIKKLDSGSDVEYQFNIDCAVEGIKRITSEEEGPSPFSQVLQVTKLVDDVTTKEFAEALGRWSQLKTNKNLWKGGQKPWFETYHLMGRLSIASGWSQTEEKLKKLSDLIFEQLRAINRVSKTDLLPDAAAARGSTEDDPLDWHLPMSIAYTWRHSIFHWKDKKMSSQIFKKIEIALSAVRGMSTSTQGSKAVQGVNRVIKESTQKMEEIEKEQKGDQAFVDGSTEDSDVAAASSALSGQNFFGDQDVKDEVGEETLDEATADG